MCPHHSSAADSWSRRTVLALAVGATAGLGGCAAVAPERSSAPDDGDWPMQGCSPQGSYHATTPDAPVDGVTERWRHSFDRIQPPRREPVLFDGTLVLTRHRTHLLDAETGSARTVDVRFRSVPAAATETAYRNATLVGLLTQAGGGGPLADLFPAFGVAGVNPARGLDVGDGLRRRWNYPPSPGSVSPWDPDSPAPPVVVGRRVLLGGRWRDSSGTAFGGVLALDASTGEADWGYTPDAETEYAVPFGRPSVHDGIAYAGSIRHAVHAVDLDTGRAVWTQRVTEAAGASVPHVVTTDDVVVAVEDEEAVGLAPADGAVLWRRPFEGSLSGHDRRPTTVADGTLFLPVETEETPRLLAVDTANGAVRWRADVGPAGGVPVVARGVVYHSTAERLLALDATDGSVRWEFSDGGDAEGLGTPVVGTGGLYVAGLDAVYALAEGPA